MVRFTLVPEQHLECMYTARRYCLKCMSLDRFQRVWDLILVMASLAQMCAWHGDLTNLLFKLHFLWLLYYMHIKNATNITWWCAVTSRIYSFVCMPNLTMWIDWCSGSPNLPNSDVNIYMFKLGKGKHQMALWLHQSKAASLHQQQDLSPWLNLQVTVTCEVVMMIITHGHGDFKIKFDID